MAAAGVLVAIAGCSSAGSSAASSPSASSSASASGAASAPASGTAPASGAASGTAAAGALPTGPQVPAPAASGQLTGTQLEAVLLPAADFPAGYAAASSGPVSSGGTLTSGVATYNLATVSCSAFVQHLGVAGFGETAMVSGSVSNGGRAFDEFIYQFPAAAQASAFVSGIRALAARCSSFKLTSGSSTVTFGLSARPGTAVGGHPSLELTETGKLSGRPINLDLLLAADGVDVFGAAAVGAGEAAPTVPARADIIYNLMKRQAAAAELG